MTEKLDLLMKGYNSMAQPDMSEKEGLLSMRHGIMQSGADHQAAIAGRNSQKCAPLQDFASKLTAVLQHPIEVHAPRILGHSFNE